MATTRRDFLELSARLAAGGCLLGLPGRIVAAPARGILLHEAPSPNDLVYGVQMFMVRKQVEKDLAAALKLIKDTGYDQVELYPIAYKHPAPELKQMVHDAGLASVAAHFNYEDREKNVEYAHALGLKYMVCPSVPGELTSALDGWRRAADYFSQWAEAAQKAGMEFAYHNHNAEFAPLAGSTGFATLMQATDPHLVKLELDLYWLAYAGQDPSATLTKYANRTVLVHLKDMAAGTKVSTGSGPDGESHQVDIGKGTIDWPTILSQARTQGIRYAFMDMDHVQSTVEDSLRVSRAYLRTLKI